jgi:hypothetical protein
MPRTPQPLHILRKDITHLWPEITAVLALFAAFAACTPEFWEGSPYAGIVALVSFLLHVLMPISWLVLISRLIHDEPLVGNRQFWTSRPYHWANLLASKVLFLLLFIYLPFFVMQCALLKHAGLHPMLSLAPLGQNLLLLSAIFILPIAAIAAVTGSFTRLLLSFIGGVLYMLVAFGVVVWLVFLKMRPESFNVTVLTLMALLPLAALINQYATRNTRVSVGILLATPLVLILVAGGVPFGGIARASYVKPGSSEPVIGDLPMRAPAPRPGRLVEFRGAANVELPFTIAKADKDSAYRIKGVAATITGAGVNWTSEFSAPLEEEQISAGAPVAGTVLPVPASLFNKIKDTPVNVHLTLLTDHLKVDPTSTWKATAQAFDIPGHGVCAFPPESSNGAPDPTCRFAGKAPEILLVTGKVATGSCASAADSPVTGQASLGQEPALPNLLDPVASTRLAMRTGDPNKQHQYFVCPGTPLNFFTVTQAGKVAFEVDLRGLILNNYAMRQQPRLEAAPASGPQQPQQ